MWYYFSHFCYRLYAKCNDNDQAALIYEKYLNVYGEEFVSFLSSYFTCCFSEKILYSFKHTSF